jgi:hypothetical protein
LFFGDLHQATLPPLSPPRNSPPAPLAVQFEP